jgi:hypothetical protein
VYTIRGISAKFRRAGWSVEKAEKDLDSGLSEVRKRLEPDGNMSVEATGGKAPPVIRWGTSDSASSDSDPDPGSEEEKRVGLLVSARCENLIREFLGYKEKHVGKSAADDHCCDSLRYCVMGVAGGSKFTRRKARTNV